MLCFSFFNLLFMRLFQLCAHGHKVSKLTQVESNFFFVFLIIFFQLHSSTFDCLIIVLHSFIQYVFDGVTIVSRLGHIFSILTWMSSSLSFIFIHCHFFLLVYLLSLYFLFILFKLVKLIKWNQINNTNFKIFLASL